MRFIYILLALLVPVSLNSSNFTCIKNGYNIELYTDIYRGYLSKNIKIDDNYNIDADFKEIENLEISYDKSLLTILKYLTYKNNFAVYDTRLGVLKIINQDLKPELNKFIKLTINNYKFPPVRIKLNISAETLYKNLSPDIITYNKGYFDLYFRIPNEISNDISNLYFFSIDSDNMINSISIGNIDEKKLNNILKNKFQKSYNDLDFLNELYPFGLETTHKQIVLFNEYNQLFDISLIRTPLPHNINVNKLENFNSDNCDISKLKIYIDNNKNNYFNNNVHLNYKKLTELTFFKYSLNLLKEKIENLNNFSSNINQKLSLNIYFTFVLILFSIFVAFKNRDYINQLLINICLVDSIFISMFNSSIFLLPIIFSNFFNKNNFNYLLVLFSYGLLYFFVKDILFEDFGFILTLFFILNIFCIKFKLLKYIYFLIFDIFLFINLDYSANEIYLYPLIIFQSLIFFKFLVDKVKFDYVMICIIGIIFISSMFSNILLASILSVPLLLLLLRYFMNYKY